MRRLLYRRGRKEAVSRQIGRKGQNRQTDKWSYGFLCILSIGFCYLFCLRSGLFGAKVDWISQHSVLPDYFRRQFYDTGNLFPEFAANIGGGQNIYNFAYYGLYNPVILPSYLLPFVKMSDYMMAVQLLGLIASVLLMYKWLRRRGFLKEICIGAAVYFLLAGPMIFHSYNQIMFVNYMPFLIMGLMETDRYFEGRKNVLGGIIFLMIMTSFYFSIGGMLALILYGMHRYLMVCGERGEKITCRGFLAEGIRFLLPFATAVLMSGVLLVPTALALTGREGSNVNLSLADLLLPQISMDRFCYSPYGIGMTTLGVTALTAMLSGRKRHERVLAFSCIVVLTIPLFAYLLNGGLYVRDKVMIPFLPLLCYVLAYYLDSLEKADAKFLMKTMIRVCPYLVTIGFIYASRRRGEAGEYWELLILDGFVMLIFFLVCSFYQVKSMHSSVGVPKDRNTKAGMLLLVPSIVMLVIFDCRCHGQADRAVSREFYEEITDPAAGELITGVMESERGYYRAEQLGNDTENAANLNRIWNMDQYISSVYSSSYHEGYLKFRDETFGLEEPFRNFLMQSAVHNPVYQRFMGVKYLISKEEVPGYEPAECEEGQKSLGNRNSKESTKGKDGRYRVYQNDQAAPVAYGTDKVIGKEIYQKLEYPYNQLALLEYAVTEDTALKETRELPNYVKSIKLELPETIRSDEEQKVCLNLPAPGEEKTGERVLFLSFRIKNLKPKEDVAIWVEGVRNKLTAENHFYYNGNVEFAYTVPLANGQDSVEMVLGKGVYEIADVKAFAGILPDSRDGDGKEGFEDDEERGHAEDCLYQSEFQIDKNKTKGNRIAGRITMETPGYFITSIPYDDNFAVLVDGKEVKNEKVNTAFLGFRIDAGEHEVSMVYHAPGVRAGKILSVLGLALFCLQAFGGRRKQRFCGILPVK